jgi:hypothetical protein
MGLPVTENTASPARACRIIEKGLAGLTLGVIGPSRSALIAFWRIPVNGVRYLERDACVAGWRLFSGVVIFDALIVRGPGTDARFVTDLLRRRDDFSDFSEPTTDTFWWILISFSELDVTILRSSVKYPLMAIYRTERK